MKFRGDVGFTIGLPKICRVPIKCPLCEELNDTGEFVALTDRQLKRQRICIEAFLHHLNGARKIRADSVHLIDEGNARYPVAFRLMPDCLGLRLYAADSAEKRDGTV